MGGGIGVLHHFHGDFHGFLSRHALDNRVAHFPSCDDTLTVHLSHGGVVAAPLDGGRGHIRLLHLHSGVDGVGLPGGNGHLVLAHPDGDNPRGGVHHGDRPAGHLLPLHGGDDGGAAQALGGQGTLQPLALHGDHVVLTAGPENLWFCGVAVHALKGRGGRLSHHNVLRGEFQLIAALAAQHGADHQRRQHNHHQAQDNGHQLHRASPAGGRGGPALALAGRSSPGVLRGPAVSVPAALPRAGGVPAGRGTAAGTTPSAGGGPAASGAAAGGPFLPGGAMVLPVGGCALPVRAVKVIIPIPAAPGAVSVRIAVPVIVSTVIVPPKVTAVIPVAIIVPVIVPSTGIRGGAPAGAPSRGPAAVIVIIIVTHAIILLTIVLKQKSHRVHFNST